MQHAEILAAVSRFFDEFVDAFRVFDGGLIAQRYLSPYLAMQADNGIEVFRTPAEIAQYFQFILDEYFAKGCRYCRYRDLEVIRIDPLRVLGTVSWELFKDDGSLVVTWRESYSLAWDGSRWRVFASIDHPG